MQAHCRFRDWDGRLRPVTATGPTKAKAIAALRAKLAERDRFADMGQPVTPDTPFPKLAALWLAEVEGNVPNDWVTLDALRVLAHAERI